MKINFEYVSALQYKVKALNAQVKAYESGEAYRSMKADYERQLREKDRIIEAQKKELAASHLETVTIRNNWQRHSDKLTTRSV